MVFNSGLSGLGWIAKESASLSSGAWFSFMQPLHVANLDVLPAGWSGGKHTRADVFSLRKGRTYLICLCRSWHRFTPATKHSSQGWFQGRLEYAPSGREEIQPAIFGDSTTASIKNLKAVFCFTYFYAYFCLLKII
jgi:hypothetical protein